MALRLEVRGPATATVAWRRYTRPSQWSTWAPQIRRVSGESDPVAAGDRGWVHGPWPLRVPYAVTAVDHEARRWSWRVGVAAAAVSMEHGVDRTASGCRAWLRIDVPAPLAFPYAPLVKLALGRLVRP